MSASPAHIAVSTSKDFSASAEQVFDAWLDPGKVASWFAPGLGPMCRIDIDPRVGGGFHLDQERAGGITRHRGEYLKLQRPRRLAFTWQAEGGEGYSLVQIDIQQLPDGGCHLELIHTMDAAWAGYADRTRQGWATMLEGMERGLSREAEQGGAARKLLITQAFPATPEVLYAAWTDPVVAGGWLLTGAGSEQAQHLLDVRPGGRWQITDRRDGSDYTAHGEYLAVEPAHRLVFTFAMPQFSPDSDRLTVEFEPAGDGCMLRLTQEGAGIDAELGSLPAGAPSSSETGWREMFDRLATLLIRSSGRAGQPDTATLHFERLLPGSLEQLWPWLTVSDKRAQWLAAGDMPGATGDAFELHFDNTRLSPRRTLIPERFRRYDKVCTTAHRLTCREPPHRLGFTWGGEGEDASAVHIELSPAGDQTRLTLTHSRLVNGAERINVASGWHTHLAILADRLAGRTPPPFWLLFEGLETDYAKRLKAADLDVGV